MFDTTRPEDGSPSSGDSIVFQFAAFEIGPTAGGQLTVSLSSTYLDESSLEFFADDIETLRVATIDEAVSVIRRSLTDALHAQVRKEH
jgi:hypothetical protein